MRKFSKILALLLAVSLIGGAFALTASATGETMLVTSNGYATYFNTKPSINASKATNFASQDGAGGNMINSNSIYNFATITCPTDDNDNNYLSFVKPTGVTKSSNGYLYISTSLRGLSTAKLDANYSGYDDLKKNVTVLDFDIMGMDVDNNGSADWSALKFINFNWATTAANGGTKDISSNYPTFAAAFGSTPNVWHHVTVINTYDVTSDRTYHYLYVDGVLAGTKYIASALGTATAGVANYLTIGVKNGAGTQSDDFWGFGLDNVVVNSYPITYADVGAADGTFAKLMADGNYSSLTAANIESGRAQPLYMYKGLAYYSETYAPFNPNPAVATVNGVKYSTLGAALANLTDGKTLETALNVENYTPGDVTSVNIKAPLVTLSDEAKAAGFVMATWMDADGNAVMTKVCKSGTAVTHPESVLLSDEENPYYGWCTTAIGYSQNVTDVVTEDVVFTPDNYIPVEAKVTGIWYNVNIDSSFDIVVYSPIHYMKDENGEFVKVNPEVEGVVFTGMGGNKSDDFDGEYVQIGENLYAKAIYRQVSMRKTHDPFLPEFYFTVNGVEMTYTMEITITSYAEAVWKTNPCGSEAATLVTAMMNYAESFRYYKDNKNATTAAVREGGAHYNCACQTALAAYAVNPYAEEMTKLTEGEDYAVSNRIKGFTMQVLINEPSIALEIDATVLGNYAETAGEGKVNGIRYTYTNYRGQKVTETLLYQNATDGGWAEFFANGETVLAKCVDIYVVDILSTVTIELITCKELNETNPYSSTFETLETVKYSVAEYYEYLTTGEAAADGVTEEDIAKYQNSLEMLYALAQAAREYRTK